MPWSRESSWMRVRCSVELWRSGRRWDRNWDRSMIAGLVSVWIRIARMRLRIYHRWHYVGLWITWCRLYGPGKGVSIYWVRGNRVAVWIRIRRWSIAIKSRVHIMRGRRWRRRWHRWWDMRIHNRGWWVWTVRNNTHRWSWYIWWAHGYRWWTVFNISGCLPRLWGRRARK